MEKRRKIIWYGLLVLFLLTLALIWGHSAESREVSKEKSMKVADTVSGLAVSLFGENTDVEKLVRKGAHFLEFSLLGCELALLMLLRRRDSLQDLFNCLFCGLLAAVIDESIQVLSQRGSRLPDVLLDFAGVIAGSVLLFWIHEVRAKRRAARASGGG